MQGRGHRGQLLRRGALCGKAGGFGRVVFRVSDVAALRTRLLAAGYKVDPVNASPTGYQVLIVYDPDGYRLEFVTPGPAKP